jgi:hypothetical protein
VISRIEVERRAVESPSQQQARTHLPLYRYIEESVPHSAMFDGERPLLDSDSIDEFSGNMASIRVLPMQRDVSTAHHKRNSKGEFTGKFHNPWPSWRGLSLKDAYESYMDGATLKPPPEAGENESPDKNGRMVKVRRPEWEQKPQNGEELEKSRAKVCWLGHAGTFVQLPWPDREGAKGVRENEGVGILFDPIFSKR